MSTADDVPTVILCDWAEVVSGKLYLMGAGWSIVHADVPATLAVAILWRVPWDQANRPMNIQIQFKNEDGGELIGPDGSPVIIEGTLEAGRPPGIKPGSGLDAPLAFKFAGITFPPGGYVVEFQVNRHVVASAGFQAITAGGLQ